MINVAVTLAFGASGRLPLPNVEVTMLTSYRTDATLRISVEVEIALCVAQM
jgi:hypothetical protein